MIDPSKFIYNSQFKYQKIAQKGVTETTYVGNGWFTLATGVAQGSTWRIGHRFDDSLDSSPGLARLTSDGKLQVFIDKWYQATIEKWYWRIYAP